MTNELVHDGKRIYRLLTLLYDVKHTEHDAKWEKEHDDQHNVGDC